MSHAYICPTIPQNLRKEESYVQIAEALNYLSNVSDDMFQRVNTRIKSNRAKLHSISSRVQAAQEKIHRISAAKHAVQIFSSSKYPATGIEERPYQSLFSTNSPLAIKRFEYQYKQPAAQTLDDPVEKLEFYHEPAVGDTIVRLDGLGSMPSDITYVGDLLFYNSGKNAYKQSTIIEDPLERAVRAHIATATLSCQNESAESNLGAAPQSIADKNADPLNQMRADSYFYFPDIGDVPTLDVPLDLPNLQGIADDVHYITNKELSIAPSLQHGHAKLICNSNNAQVPPPIQPTPITEELKTITKQQDAPKMNIVQEVSVVEDVRQEDGNGAPVRPKEQPAVSVPDSSEDVADVGDKTSTTLPIPLFSPVDDPHATLMEAIRKAAGGRNLRSAKVAENASGSSSGDLMTDLHSKLLMRRKGISGSRLGGSGEPQTVMDKISDMIPAPILASSTYVGANDALSESITTEEDDWED